jgi:hypothetical protein
MPDLAALDLHSGPSKDLPQSRGILTVLYVQPMVTDSALGRHFC